MPLKKKFRVVVRTDPPDATSAAEEARWGKLADTLLRPEETKESRLTTRAHEDHKRLSQELEDTLERYERKYRRAA